MNKLTADKCREQFETWAINQCTYDLAYSDATKQSHRSMKAKAAWKIWQASRQALEIALPVLEQGGWISCSERMPEIGQDVLYYFEFVGVHAGVYVEFNTFSSGRGFLCGDVTHWMPLPAPPQPQPSTNPQIDNDEEDRGDDEAFWDADYD